jgi:hypothetical protein
MRSVKELRRKAASRPRKKATVYSTSEARANFAEALETAQIDCDIIGFDRYGRTIAALVPVEAIYLLAGLHHLVEPAVRTKIEAAARTFAQSVPNRVNMRGAAATAPKAASRTPAKKKSGEPTRSRTRRRV